VRVSTGNLPALALVRTPRGLLRVLPWFAVPLLMRKLLPGGSLDAQVLDVGAFVIPLLSLAVIAWLLAYSGLHEATEGPFRLGQPRVRTAAAYVVTGIALSAMCSVVATGMTLAVAPASQLAAGGTKAHEWLTTCPVAALAGAGYGAWFLLGSTFARGNGRSVCFLLDLLLGGTRMAALLVPRGHLRSLLGGARVADLSPRQSSLVLLVLTLVCAGLAVARSSRRRTPS
jgi:hypothetical protein